MTPRLARHRRAAQTWRGWRTSAAALAVLLAAATAGSAPPPASAPGKFAAPDPAALAEAEKLVKQVYQAEYAAKAPADRRAFALKLLQHGAATTDDPASRYVLLREARDVAASAGDVGTAFSAVDYLAQSFTIRADLMKQGLFETASRAATTDTVGEILRTGQDLVDDAVAAGDFARADEIQQAMEAAARKALPPAEQVKVLARGRELRTLRAEDQAVQPMRERLKTAPDDAEACLAVGKYLCLSRGAWAAGLALLAKGSDAGLKAAAAADLANPVEPAAQVQVGDAWDQLAAKQTGKAKVALQNRALDWYEKALPGVTGLRKTALEMKIKTLAEVVGAQRVTAAPPTPPPSAAGATASQPAEAVAPTESVAGKTYQTLAQACWTQDLVVGPVGRWLAVTDAQVLILLDPLTGKELRRVPRADRLLTCLLTPSMDGRRLGLVRYPQDAPTTFEVVVHDVATGRETPLGRVTLPERPALLGLSPDGSRASLASIQRGTDGQFTVTLYDAATGKERWRATLPAYQRAAFSADGKRLIVATANADLSVYDALAGQVVQTLDAPPDAGGYTSALVSSADGRQLVSVVARGYVSVWDLASGQQVKSFLSPLVGVNAVARSPDGRRLALLGGRGLAVHDVDSGRLVAFWTVPRHVRMVQFAPDGRFLVTSAPEPTLLAWPLPR